MYLYYRFLSAAFNTSVLPQGMSLIRETMI